jgi:hypothetical protein
MKNSCTKTVRVSTMSQPGEIAKVQPGEISQDQSREITKVQPGEISKDQSKEIKKVDVCICMDVTASMGPYLRASRETVLEAFDTLRTMHPECVFRLSCVMYRDFGDKTPFVVVPFTEHINTVRDHMNDTVVSGGDDAAEDVAGALEHISGLEWQGQVKTIFFVTDAPAHGTDYHPITISDRYPRGDPDGRDPKRQLTELASRGIDFTIFRVTRDIDMMIKQFDVAYKDASATGVFTVLDVEKQLATAPDTYEEDDDYMDRCIPDMDRMPSIEFESCIKSIPSHESCVRPTVSAHEVFKSGLVAMASASVERRK